MNNINLSIPYFYDFETSFTLTVSGEISGIEFDKARLLEQLKKHVFQYVPPVMHNQIQSSKLVLHERVNAFAIKLFIGDVEFYFVSRNREVQGVLGDSINYHIVSTDEKDFLKHEILMNLQIKQHNEEVARLVEKKQRETNAQNEYAQSLNDLKKAELEKVFYNSDGSINYFKTTIQALEKEGLL